MVAVKKDTRNHLSQRRLAQLGTVKKNSSDSGHMTSHFSLLHAPAVAVGGGEGGEAESGTKAVTQPTLATSTS